MFDGDTLNDMNIFHSGGKAEILYSIILHFLLLHLVHNQILFLNYILTNRKLVLKLFVQDFGYIQILAYTALNF